MSSSDGFEIELGQSVRRHIENKRSPLEDGKYAAFPYEDPRADQIPVFITESVMREIETHVRREKYREVGGVLLGGFYRNDKGSFIEITGFIAAKNTKSTDVSLTFTPETWEQISAEQAQRNDTAQMVGWYHSHPGLGVFMSKEDEFIHSSYFNDPWHTAIVVDPIYSNWGCFKWHDGALERTHGFYIYGPKKSAGKVKDYARTISSSRQSVPRAASASADRRDFSKTSASPALWAVVTLLFIFQLITGYYAFSRRNAPPGKPDNYNIAMELLSASDMSDGARYLRQELIIAPNNERAYKELQRLNAALNPETNNEKIDSINLMLASADKLARGKMTCREQSGLDNLTLESSNDSSFKAQLESDDPMKSAVNIYESAAASHSARLQRAKTIEEIIDGSSSTSSSEIAGNMRHKDSWHSAAVMWLKQEDLRRVAYGMQAGEPSYQQQYDKMPEADKKAVRSIRAELLEVK